MKKLIIFLALLILPVTAWAMPATYGVGVAEVGGSSVDAYRIVFPSGTMTCVAGVCTYAPNATAGTFTDFYLLGPDVTHGVTSITATNAYLSGFQIGTSGGADIYGITEADQAGALRLTGIIGATDPTDLNPAVIFRGGKKNGTGWQALGAAETPFAFYNYTTPIGWVYGNGEWILPSLQNTPIGNTTASTGKFSSLELVKTDAITDCSGFTATGGGIYYDDSEGKFKKCQDNVLTDLDTTGAGHDAVTLNANITPTELLTLTGQDIALATQTANYGFFGPTSGAAAAPGFRAMVNADIPTTLTPQVTRIGVGQAADGTNLIASPGFSVDPDGNLVAKKLTSTRVAGAASVSDYYEIPANSDGKVSLKAPDSITGDTTYTVTLPSATGTLALATISRTEFLPVAWMIDGAAAPAALATVDLGTRQIRGRAFQADTADQDLEMFWQAPIDIIDGDSGTAGFQVKWRPIYIITSATAPASGESVAFALQACSSGSGDTGDCTVGTASIHADEDLDAHAQFDIVYGAYTAITVTDGAAAEGWFMKLYRDQDNAQDDYVQPVSLVGIEIKYKATLADGY